MVRALVCIRAGAAARRLHLLALPAKLYLGRQAEGQGVVNPYLVAKFAAGFHAARAEHWLTRGRGLGHPAPVNPQAGLGVRGAREQPARAAQREKNRLAERFSRGVGREFINQVMRQRKGKWRVKGTCAAMTGGSGPALQLGRWATRRPADSCMHLWP